MVIQYSILTRPGVAILIIILNYENLSTSILLYVYSGQYPWVGTLLLIVKYSPRNQLETLQYLHVTNAEQNKCTYKSYSDTAAYFSTFIPRYVQVRVSYPEPCIGGESRQPNPRLVPQFNNPIYRRFAMYSCSIHFIMEKRAFEVIWQMFNI